MRTIFITVFFIITFNLFAFSQGCSDAGFCTIGKTNFNAIDSSNNYKQKIALTLTNGIGDQGVATLTPILQYEYRLNKHWMLQGRATVNYASGNLGEVFGVGDLYTTSIYSYALTKKWKKSIVAALKIPLNNGNLEIDNKPLPMPYQSSLGTFDFIFGYTINNDRWDISIAYQQPLTSQNENEFLPSRWNINEANKYESTNNFNRNADALLRFSYLFTAGKKVSIAPGILTIFHLGNDTYLDAEKNKRLLRNSEGLTINITGRLNYQINNRCSLALSAGSPILVRESRPDGLTRSLVISPELSINF